MGFIAPTLMQPLKMVCWCALKELVVSWSITNDGGDCAWRGVRGRDYLSPLLSVPWGDC